MYDQTPGLGGIQKQDKVNGMEPGLGLLAKLKNRINEIPNLKDVNEFTDIVSFTIEGLYQLENNEFFIQREKLLIGLVNTVNHHNNLEIKKEAITRIGQIGYPEEIHSTDEDTINITEYLYHAALQEDLGIASVQALGNMGEAGLTKLIALIGEEGGFGLFDIKNSITEVLLNEISETSQVEFLRSVRHYVENSSEFASESLIELLGRLTIPEALKELKIYRERNRALYYSAFALLEMNSGESIEILYESLDDGNYLYLKIIEKLIEYADSEKANLILSKLPPLKDLYINDRYGTLEYQRLVQKTVEAFILSSRTDSAVANLSRHIADESIEPYLDMWADIVGIFDLTRIPTRFGVRILSFLRTDQSIKQLEKAFSVWRKDPVNLVIASELFRIKNDHRSRQRIIGEIKKARSTNRDIIDTIETFAEIDKEPEKVLVELQNGKDKGKAVIATVQLAKRGHTESRDILRNVVLNSNPNEPIHDYAAYSLAEAYQDQETLEFLSRLLESNTTCRIGIEAIGILNMPEAIPLILGSSAPIYQQARSLSYITYPKSLEGLNLLFQLERSASETGDIVRGISKLGKVPDLKDRAIQILNQRVRFEKDAKVRRMIKRTVRDLSL
ncbi:hypothetical protein JW796_03420 [Candidatus Dojkabacteria bacterium]|nr:hypothetical protein [Candidatus Dojkabacteria bacterium]